MMRHTAGEKLTNPVESEGMKRGRGHLRKLEELTREPLFRSHLSNFSGSIYEWPLCMASYHRREVLQRT